MIKRCVFILLALIGVLLSGCGGSTSLGKNSAIVVHLLRTDGTQIMTQFEVYITKNGATTFNTANLESFASTRNQPTWMDDYSSARSSTKLDLGFTTRSGQSDYLVFIKVPNTGAAFESLKLQIDVDGKAGKVVDFNADINQISRLDGVKISRNSATY